MCIRDSTAGIDAHHLARGQVDDGNGGLADKSLGLIVVVNAGEDHAVGTGAVVEHELQKLLALGHGGAFLDLDPVSYTHLDVYKRQDMKRPPTFLR